jgi:hypothetical protein
VKYARLELLHALVDPSRQVVAAYQVHLLSTKSGGGSLGCSVGNDRARGRTEGRPT